MTNQEILDDLINIYNGYNKVHRKCTQPYILEKIKAQFPDYVYNHDDLVVRETLIEHTGSLPIIATHLHPFLDQPVDLGKALIMLSFHDIGELIVGDEISFTKQKDQGNEEMQAAFSLLHPSYHDLYIEMDKRETPEAKFVKSIDKLAPDFLEMLTDSEIVNNRLSQQVEWSIDEVITKVQEKKRPYMIWSTFLTGFHDAIFERRRAQN